MIKFLLENILLIAIIIVCAGSLLWPVIQRRRGGPELNNASATELINHRNAQVIDLRDPKEFRSEAIARSINIPANVIQNSLGAIDKNRPVLLVDNDGRRARSAAPLLRGTGFKEVYILEGGLNAWRQARLPFTR